MVNQDTRGKLIETAKRLLTEGTPPEALTARQISAAAGTNLAMINYCFKGKDELLKIAVDQIVAEEFRQHSRMDTANITPREQLREMLLHVSNAMIKYRAITRLSIPYLMLNDEITLPLDILPFIKLHFGAKKDETACRVIAFHIVYTMQLIFYRAEDFRKYAGIDMTNQLQLEDFLDAQLDLFLYNPN